MKRVIYLFLARSSKAIMCIQLRRRKDEKLEREYPEIRSDFGLEIYDKTILNN